MTAVMEKDRQDSAWKKRKATLWLVDPQRDAKAPHPSVKGSTAVAAMPLPTTAARRIPSPTRVDEVAVAKGVEYREASWE